MATEAKRLLLILGDQLSDENPLLIDANPDRDTLLLAEVRDEANYVPHNRHKIVLIFSAMRHFCQRWRERGFTVIYREFDEGVTSLGQAVKAAVDACDVDTVAVTEPGEYRVLQHLHEVGENLSVPLTIADDTPAAEKAEAHLCGEE